MLEADTSSVLVNGVPGQKVKCKRGVRQGDPLSPLLFFHAAKIQKYVINDLMSRVLMCLPVDVGDSYFLLCSVQMTRFFY